MNATWQAIAREAALAAEHMGMGVTALGKANYAHNAHYPQAFFALSTGLERTAKLALVIDHAIQSGGTFPDNQQLRRFGHNLKQLLDAVDAIAASGRLTGKVRRLPRTPIHNSIIEVLSDFASNITRYYNLDLVTNAPGVQQTSDPIASWFDRVVEPAIAKHVTAARSAKIERNAKLADGLMGRSVMVMHHSESGQPLETVYDASQMTGLIEAVQPHVRLYVLQIVRFLASVMSELTYKTYAARLEDVPHLSEFFAIYNNEDKLLKSRKTWSIYKL
jgi:hypothetical protein